MLSSGYFNVDFNIAALFILTISGWRFFSHRQFPLPSSYLYGVLLLVGSFAVLMDTVSCFCLDAALAGTASVWPYYLTNGLFYFSLTLLPLAIAVYILEIISARSRLGNHAFSWTAVPCVVLEIILVAGFCTGTVFAVTPDEGYVRYPLSMIPYVCAALYLLIAFVLILRNRALIPAEVSRSLSVVTVVLVCLLGIQNLYPQCLLTGIAISLCLLIMLFTLHDPGSMIDAETGLFNMNAFYTFMQATLVYPRRLCLAVIDVTGIRRADGFSNARVSQAALHQVCSFLQHDKKTWIFRLSDMRFAMLTRDAVAYRRFLDHLVNRSGVEWTLPENEKVVVTFKACHTSNLEPFESVEMIQSAVGSIMEVLKKSEQGDCLFALNEATLQKVKRSNTIERGLFEELSGTGENLLLRFQPLYYFDQRGFTGVEVLLRYCHKSLGMIPPDEFVTVAEDCGLSQQLDQLVVRKVCQLISEGGLDNLGIQTIHINLSGPTVASTLVMDSIMDCVKGFRISPEMLCFEITETAAVLSRNTLKSCMEASLNEGFSFALDDFGTGYSNLVRLVDLPFSCIKIDKSLLVAGKELYGNVVKALKPTGAFLVAEGAETVEDVQLLNKLHVDAVQGYYFARPLSLDDLRDLLSREEAGPLAL